MAEEMDDYTAAEVGHALVRWLVDEDPGNIGRFAPDLDPATLDDAKAARIGRTLVELVERFPVI